MKVCAVLARSRLASSIGLTSRALGIAVRDEINLRFPDARLDPKRLAIGALGFCCSGLGALVLGSWVFEPPAHWILRSRPMPNAGIGFLVDGLALIMIAWGRERFALAGSAWSLLLGTLTLVEYLFTVRLGIDQAFIRIEDGGAYPGRIGPNVAFGFVLVGIVLWWASKRRREWKWIGAMGLLGTVVLATGAVSAITDLAGVHWHSRWSQIMPRIWGDCPDLR